MDLKNKLFDYDVIVVGGGLLGLATAYQLGRHLSALRILVLEKESVCGTHQSGHNSGVIHSGIYYKSGSQKALYCVRGRRQLLAFCRSEGIEYALCGKLIVAHTKAELAQLAFLHRQGQANGLGELRRLSHSEVLEKEPYVGGCGALWVGDTGIVDFRQVTNALVRRIRVQNAHIHCKEAVKALRTQSNGVCVETTQRHYHTRLLINCAGLHSDRITCLSGVQPEVRIIPFRGKYYQLTPSVRAKVQGLIYPVPDPNFPFLGVHFTRMIGDKVKVGPSAVWAWAREGYDAHSVVWQDVWEAVAWRGFRRIAIQYWQKGLSELYQSYMKSAFVAQARKLIPSLRIQDLQKGEWGIRAQACHKNGYLLDDFWIVEKKHYLHLCNAPSPAATACLAIGEEIAKRAQKQLTK